MDTEAKLAELERRLAEHDRLIARLTAYARLFPAGRMILKALGAS